jgi:hypothetical protein
MNQVDPESERLDMRTRSAKVGVMSACHCLCNILLSLLLVNQATTEVWRIPKLTCLLQKVVQDYQPHGLVIHNLAPCTVDKWVGVHEKELQKLLAAPTSASPSTLATRAPLATSATPATFTSAFAHLLSATSVPESSAASASAAVVVTVADVLVSPVHPTVVSQT